VALVGADNAQSLAANGFDQNPPQLRDVWDQVVFRQEIKSSGPRSGFWVSIAVGHRRFKLPKAV
jgi:hypothetical protein